MKKGFSQKRQTSVSNYVLHWHSLMLWASKCNKKNPEKPQILPPNGYLRQDLAGRWWPSQGVSATPSTPKRPNGVQSRCSPSPSVRRTGEHQEEQTEVGNPVQALLFRGARQRRWCGKIGAVIWWYDATLYARVMEEPTAF